jgi:redox-sensitive bicupin YhaK (pirin superfamily)
VPDTILKNVLGVYQSPAQHWVGDGFPVRTMFSVQQLGARISPFIMMDYGGPVEFPPSEVPRGVDEHPHKGFETITIVYRGEIEHRDSTGNAGKIGPGDVQWMTAASGIVHEEKHSREFTKRGGMMEMVQLWLNLPAKFKKEPPGYQTLLNAQIPAISLDNGSGSLRVIAGDYGNVRGPAHTFTPVDVWDLRLENEKSIELQFKNDSTTLVVLLHGRVNLNRTTKMENPGVALFERQGERVSIQSFQESSLLIINGDPIEEPIMSYGPFVMNTREEIIEAIEEYQAGRMGHLPASK